MLDGRLLQPAEEDTQHTQKILEATLFAQALAVRARAGEDDEVFTTNAQIAAEEKLAKVCQFLTGDIRNEHVIDHHCPGCCRDVDDCADQIAASLMEAGLLHAGTGSLPSKGRWGSTASSHALR